ncbi:rhomboid family intramembrane serine protease [Gilliamella sp. ESL0250]|uniref:rhomboid family intramembrane serine protease n=1 Tax=Gilliamella sp. ESL0250 TaxID=2705036 RepID=UPI0015801969|nr:rhomboid family intramembrane serine protease [Gilliamella sp. ESL0250]NUF50130.1 rhomboid family intramembrane serine protease [Gilliamella sp. ESL0250]
MSTLNDIKYYASQSKITSTLVVINILCFFVFRLLDSRGFSTLYENHFLIDWGADVAGLTFSGQYWRMFTNLFMHVGFTHLAMNMLALWSIGPILEKRIPAIAFLGIYLFSGLVGSLSSDIATINQNIISCGASGAILGIITALLAYCLVFKANIQEMPVKVMLISLILTAGLGLLPSIDNMAHIGGACAGFVLGGLISLCIKTFKYPSKLTLLIISLLFIVTALGLYIVYMHYALPSDYYIYN